MFISTKKTYIKTNSWWYKEEDGKTVTLCRITLLSDKCWKNGWDVGKIFFDVFLWIRGLKIKVKWNRILEKVITFCLYQEEKKNYIKTTGYIHETYNENK